MLISIYEQQQRVVEGDVCVFLYLQVIEDDRPSSDDISTNDDDMFQSILHTLFSTSASSVPLQSPPPAAESSGYGRYKKDIRNCIDHDNDEGDTTPPPMVDEGKHSTTINDDTTIATTSTLPPPRRRRYIKKPKKQTNNSESSSMLMSNINLIM